MCELPAPRQLRRSKELPKREALHAVAATMLGGLIAVKVMLQSFMPFAIISRRMQIDVVAEKLHKTGKDPVHMINYSN